MNLDARAWVQRVVHDYSDNAVNRKDFRSQLRGGRPILLWAIYLLILSVVVCSTYTSATEKGQDLYAIQTQLHTLYTFLITRLQFGIIFIAPSMTALAIVSEHSKKSIDLLLTTPTSVKHLMVGKLIGAFRYIWLLLALSLPLISVGVVMGGMSWTGVLTDFARIAITSLVFCSVGLLASAQCKNVIMAVVAAYVYGVSVLLGVLTLPTIGASGFGMSPTFFYQAILSLATADDPVHDSSFQLWGLNVPYWIIGALICFTIIRVVLMAASAAFVPSSSRDLTLSRVIILVVPVIAGTSVASSLVMLSSTAVAEPILYYWAVGGALIAPYWAITAKDASNKGRNDGYFSIKKVLKGTPAGALPYMLLNLTVAAVVLLCTYPSVAQKYGARHVIGSITGSSSAGISASGGFLTAPTISSVVELVALNYILGASALFAAWAICRRASKDAWEVSVARKRAAFCLALTVAIPALLISAVIIVMDPYNLNQGNRLTHLAPFHLWGPMDDGFYLGHTAYLCVIGYLALKLRPISIKRRQQAT